MGRPRGRPFDQRARTELRVPFPFQPQVTEVVHEMLGTLGKRRDAEAGAVGGDDLVRAFPVVAHVDREMRHAGGRLGRQERPRVDFARQGEPLRMIQGCGQGHGQPAGDHTQAMVSHGPATGLPRAPGAVIIAP